MTETALDVCHALWIGPRLGPVAHACLRSFVWAGHRVVLHAYANIEDVPSGVEIADANAIVPSPRVFRHAITGSYALFSDYFRYKLLERGLGTYVDCDVVCIRPLEPNMSHVFGYQGRHALNGAVLKLPGHSPMLRDLVSLFESRVFAPPWYRRRRRLRQYVKAALGIPADVIHAPWGSAGPTAVTYFAKKHGLMHLALPVDVLYPVRHRQARCLLDPNVDPATLVTERTRCLHLWNEALPHVPFADLAPGCLLQRLIAGDWPSTRP